jgi:hypothetical protein
VGFGTSVVRAAAGAAAHLGWWLAWQTRARASEACVEATEPTEE